MKTKNTKNKSKKIKIMCIYILATIGIITPLIAVPLAIHVKNANKTLEKHATNLQKLLDNKIFEVKDKQILNSNWKINKTLQLVEINNIIKKTLPNINNNLKIMFKITQIIKTNSIQIQAIITFNEDFAQKLATFTIKGFYNPIKINNQVIQKALNKVFEKAQMSNTLIIPNGITSDQFNNYVNNHSSFENNYKNIIVSITFPNSFTYIDDWFQNFKLITSLKLGARLQTIGRNAFGRAKLKTLVIPNAITKIGKFAFYNSPLRSLILGTKLQTIGDYAFYEANLQKLVIPNAVIKIGDSTFENSPLESLILGEGLQTIGDWAFYEANLQKLVIPNAVIQIGRESFENSPLESLILGTNLQTIGGWAFVYAKLKTLVIPNAVTQIGQEAFQNSPLTSLILGTNLQTIGDKAFEYARLKTLLIHDAVTQIGQEAFQNSPLTSLTLGVELQTIEHNAFEKSIINIFYKNTGTKITIKENKIIIPKTINSKITIQVKSIKKSIKTSENKKAIVKLNVLFNGTIINTGNVEVNSKFIEFDETPLKEALKKAQTSKNLIIPSGITSNQFNYYVNNHSSFQDDYKDKITSITFPDSFTYIGDWFQNFNLITLVKLGVGLQTIGEHAFRNAQLKTLVIPDTITQISKKAFALSPLTSLKLGTGLQIIGHSAFARAQLTTLVVPDAVTKVDGWAFRNSPLKLLKLGTNLKTIGDWAFAEAQLTTLVIPNTVTKIKYYAFYNSKLTSLKLGTKLQAIGEHAFLNAKLTTLVIPNKVTQIGKWAFKDSLLTSLKLGTKLQTIGANAFNANIKLKVFVGSNISIKDGSQTKVASIVTKEDIILPRSLDSRIKFKIKSINKSTKTLDEKTVAIKLEVLFNNVIFIKNYNIELSGFNQPS